MKVLLIACLLIVGGLALPSRALACGPTEITANTPTGIAGCERWGEGIASMYGPGTGVAMNFCTWERRTTSGCGSVTITSLDSGRVVTAPVMDFCDCYTGTPDERIVDLQWGVVSALGLDPRAGLWRVAVWPLGGGPKVTRTKTDALPDTSMAR